MALRVLVVDDTVVFRRIVSDALAGIPDVEVVGNAANGKLALARMAQLKPDLITLDVEMPEMNGIELLERMCGAGDQTGVIVLSAHTVHGGELTIRALELGAFDFITKPEGGSPVSNVEMLRGRLRTIIQAFQLRRAVRSGLRPQIRPLPPRPVRPVAPVRPEARLSTRNGPPIVVIGVSTGGPGALAKVVPALPAGLDVPVFIVQHMPPLFTQPLAASLNAKSALRVKEGKDGECAEPGSVYLAPGGSHMKVIRGARGEAVIRITDDPPENNCKPSVDYLFRSVAINFPGRAVAVILTGMGNDGTQGLRQLKRGGCASIAQDEASCVVFGMPKEAIAAGVVDVVAPLEGVAPAILQAIKGARS